MNESAEREDWGFYLSGWLLEACGDALPAEARRTLEEVERGQPDPARVAALPEAIGELVDVSGCNVGERARLAESYAQLKRDARHRVSGRMRLVKARGGVTPREHDVEVLVTWRGVIELDGAPVANAEVLAGLLAARTTKQRLVTVMDGEQTFGQLREIAAAGAKAGFVELGLLVVHEGTYRVLPINVLPRDRVGELAVLVAVDGFFVDSADEGPEPDTARSRRPDVVLIKPGAPLEDRGRWDFAALARWIDEHTPAGERRPTASLRVEDEVCVRDVVTVAELLRGADCEEEGGGRCRVGWLGWVL